MHANSLMMAPVICGKQCVCLWSTLAEVCTLSAFCFKMMLLTSGFDNLVNVAMLRQMLLLQKHQQQLLQQHQQHQQQHLDESSEPHQKSLVRDDQWTQLEHIKHKRKDEESRHLLVFLIWYSLSKYVVFWTPVHVLVVAVMHYWCCNDLAHPEVTSFCFVFVRKWLFLVWFDFLPGLNIEMTLSIMNVNKTN